MAQASAACKGHNMSEVEDPKVSTLDPKLKSILEVEATDDKNFIYCSTCSHVVTQVTERIAVSGSHDHHFTNPHGFQFHVGCFAQALGCAISGEAEAADSWFMGRVWRLASCGDCNVHLGWYFSLPSGEDAFYGLILDRLQQEGAG